MPFIPQFWAAATNLAGVELSKFSVPLADRIIGHVDAAIEPHLFDVTLAKAQVLPLTDSDKADHES